MSGARTPLDTVPPQGAAVQFAPLAAAATALGVYVATLAPGLPAGDSGELITAAATLGVAHPPGYPLYTLLGHAWIALLPWGSVAWRMNLFSAVCAALAVGVIARVVVRLTREPVAGLLAGLLLAFSPPFWKNALVAEVFALNALLAACLLGAFAGLLESAAGPGPRPARVNGPPRGRRDSGPVAPAVVVAAPPRPAWPLLTLAFLNALLLSHHHTLILLALPVDLAVLVLLFSSGSALRRPGAGGRRLLAPDRPLAGQAALAFALGLAPLLAIPILAARHPLLSWDDVHDVVSFLRLLLRADYGTFRLDPSGAGQVADRSHLALYAESLPDAFGPLGIALLAFGMWAMRRRRALFAVLAGFAVLQALFFTRVGFPSQPPVFRGVIERFYVLPDLVLALVAGLGAAALLAAFPARAGARWRTALAIAMLAGACGLGTFVHGPRLSQRDNRSMEHLAGDVLASVPRGGVLFVQGDVFHNGLAYLTQVGKRRPDVTVVDQELLTYDWYVRALRRRSPELLPALGGGERLHLRDARVVEGKVLETAPDTLGVLTPEGYLRLARRDVASLEAHPDPRTLFAEARRAVPASPLVPAAIDRYSGLPGTVNVLWLDHLIGHRPVAFLGLKDDSWTLRYELVPQGHVLVAYPRGRVPETGTRAALALAQLGAFAIEDYFRPLDPWSFEAGERRRVAGFVAGAALLLSQPEAAALDTGAAGYARLAAFATRFERLEPTPDPELLRALGMARQFNARLRDPVRATADLRRYLASGAQGDEAVEARRALQQATTR